jgi:hypothetical protein
MMTAEELKVLAYLRHRPYATLPEVSRSCLAGCSPAWAGRVVSRLDWYGYVAVLSGPGGPAAVQITERGRGYTGG